MKSNENKDIKQLHKHIKNKDTVYPLCKDGVCKIPENNLKMGKITDKNIMIKIDE